MRYRRRFGRKLIAAEAANLRGRLHGLRALRPRLGCLLRRIDHATCCCSGAMFVQSERFVECHGRRARCHPVRYSVRRLCLCAERGGQPTPRISTQLVDHCQQANSCYDEQDDDRCQSASPLVQFPRLHAPRHLSPLPSSITEYRADKMWVLRQINQPFHSVMHGIRCPDDGRRSNSGSLAKFAAMGRASSLVSRGWRLLAVPSRSTLPCVLVSDSRRSWAR